MVDPNSLMYWVDDWRNRDPGTVGGKKLIVIAHQMARRARDLWRKKPKNVIFQIEDTREIVYKRRFDGVAAMKMGISQKRIWNSKDPRHKHAVPMEEYAKYFIDKIDADWLARNNYVLM